MAEVDVPAVGSVKQKYVMVGGALVVGIVGYAYYKRRQAAASASVPAVDPNATGASVTDTGPGVQGNAPNVQYAGTTTPGDTAILTNADWANLAVQDLSNEGWDAITVREAIGAYLAGEPLNASQTQIIQAAISAAGTPPQGVQNIPAPGLPTPSPSAPKTPSGFHATGVTDTGFQLNWYADTSVNTYHLYEGSTLVGTDNGTYHPFTGKTPGTKYGPYYLAAVSPAGKESEKAGPLYVTTSAGAQIPKAPQSFHAWDVTNHGFTLSWNADAGATSYHLYEGSKLIATDNGTWHPFTTMRPRTKYGPYYLAGVNSAGKEGPKSGPVYVTTSK